MPAVFLREGEDLTNKLTELTLDLHLKSTPFDLIRLIDNCPSLESLHLTGANINNDFPPNYRPPDKLTKFSFIRSTSGSTRVVDYFVNLKFLAVDLASLPSLSQPEPRLELIFGTLEVLIIDVEMIRRDDSGLSLNILERVLLFCPKLREFRIEGPQPELFKYKPGQWIKSKKLESYSSIIGRDVIAAASFTNLTTIKMVFVDKNHFHEICRGCPRMKNMTVWFLVVEDLIHSLTCLRQQRLSELEFLKLGVAIHREVIPDVGLEPSYDHKSLDRACNDAFPRDEDGDYLSAFPLARRIQIGWYWCWSVFFFFL